MFEVNEAAKIITSSAADDAKVIFGATIDETLGDNIRITVIATGFGDRRPTISNESEEDKQSYFSSAKFTTTFLRKSQKEEAEEERKFKQITQKPIQQSYPTPVSQGISKDDQKQQITSPKTTADDELEIPAFIRKKMGV
jgi:cell division protein FtsZ